MTSPHWKILIAATVTAFCGGFQITYHSNIINEAQIIFVDFINRTNIERTGNPMSDDAIALLWGWIVTVFSLGGLVATFAIPFLAEKCGRKITFMVLCNLMAIGSSLLMSFSQMAHSYEMLAVGRFIMGFSSGIALALLPAYLSECSAIEHRGFMGTLQIVFNNLTGLFSFAIAIPKALGTWNYLPYLLGLGIVPALLQILTSFFLMDSPKYLYIKRKDVVAAEKSVRFWFATASLNDLDVKEVFQQFDQEAEAEATAMKERVGLLRALKVPYFRKAFIVSTVIFVCQVFTGVGVVNSYSTNMLLKVGFSIEEAGICTIMNSVVMTISALVVAPFLDRYPRRRVFFLGYCLLFFALVAFMLLCLIYDWTMYGWAAKAALACMYLFWIAFNIGAGALTFMLPSEISPQEIRSTVLAVGNGVSWLVMMITTFIYPPLELKAGPWSLFIFIGPLFLCLIYLFKFMPETGGKTVAEVVNEYTSRGKVTSDKEEQQ